MKLLRTVSAHCDIPCGIYETDTMTHAAATCRRMIEKIEELGTLDSVEKHNSFVRCVMIKERHAQRVKDELSILWTDYFKPVHVERYPELHDTIWWAAKQASSVKQTVSMEEAERLVEAIHEVAQLFDATKQPEA